MLDSLDTAARRAVSRARWHATRLDHVDVDTLHLLLGVIEHLTEVDDERIAELDLDRLRAQVALRAPATADPAGRRGFTLGATWVFERVAAIADLDACEFAGVPHLWQSILDADHPDAGAVECVILAAGGEPSRLREDRLGVVLEPRTPTADLELEFHPGLTPEQVAIAIAAVGDVFHDFGGAGFEVRLDARELECPLSEVIS
ncbi:MAG: hypothetical protein AB7I19_07930 [Planctomycetota bacterium]